MPDVDSKHTSIVDEDMNTAIEGMGLTNPNITLQAIEKIREEADNARRISELRQFLKPTLRVEQHGADIPEKDPNPSSHPPVWEMVIVDMQLRDQMGQKKYGTRLRSFNGRDALMDAYQEALDLVVYLRQAIYERDMPIAPTGYEYDDSSKYEHIERDHSENDE